MTNAPTDLIEVARRARENAYGPYSGIKVGAAVRTSDGRVYAGCNVENSSYGGTVCAERVAIWNAVAAQGRSRIAEILVMTDAEPAWPPCGLCRQVIAEFADGSTPVHSCNTEGKVKTRPFSALFPEAFTPAHLHK